MVLVMKFSLFNSQDFFFFLKKKAFSIISKTAILCEMYNATKASCENQGFQYGLLWHRKVHQVSKILLDIHLP